MLPTQWIFIGLSMVDATFCMQDDLSSFFLEMISKRASSPSLSLTQMALYTSRALTKMGLVNAFPAFGNDAGAAQHLVKDTLLRVHQHQVGNQRRHQVGGANRVRHRKETPARPNVRQTLVCTVYPTVLVAESQELLFAPWSCPWQHTCHWCGIQ